MDKRWNIEKDLDIIEEKGNQYTALRVVQWYNNNIPKLEVRRWRVDSGGEDIPSTGMIFMTEEGPHRLAEALVKHGYGDTKTILDYLKERNESYSMDGIIRENEQKSNESVSLEGVDEEEEFYDPKQIF